MASVTIRSLQWSTPSFSAHSTAAFFCVHWQFENSTVVSQKPNRKDETMKRCLTIILIVFVVVALMGTGVWSYVKTGWQRSVVAVKENVPIEFEIDRARMMVQDLVSEVRRNMHVIAREEVEVEQLADQVAESDRKLSKERNDILRLKDDVSKEKHTYDYSGKQYSAKQVKQDLAARFERFKTVQANHEALLEIQKARERGLGAAHQKLEQMIQVKRQLEVDVEHLEAKLRLLEVAETANDLNFDASKLGQARQVITGIGTRLKVAERVLNTEVAHLGEIELDEPQSDNIVAEISEYFGGGESSTTKPQK